MDIEGLGSETVEQLYQSNLIKNYADLYTLKKEQLLPLERMAEKSADNLIAGVEASKKIPFQRVLFALGIRYVGETVAKKLAKAYPTTQLLQQATEEELVAVDEIGSRIAESVASFFKDENNIETINRLQEYGVTIREICRVYGRPNRPL